ncbi:hypothetical protein BDV95DRAFT_605210 [Massariosphaeria phaeospora]|uniref:Uncharacterized protein n=1 Tax=Massariosphaeria phaeospora TaxID=100035 RepID=A0A7C8I937_9PLEO|nr:hypothetical protein BDV95DRAFT_605210 [Massariosphaeria phaeospora]
MAPTPIPLENTTVVDELAHLEPTAVTPPTEPSPTTAARRDHDSSHLHGRAVRRKPLPDSASPAIIPLVTTASPVGPAYHYGSIAAGLHDAPDAVSDWPLANGTSLPPPRSSSPPIPRIQSPTDTIISVSPSVLSAIDRDGLPDVFELNTARPVAYVPVPLHIIEDATRGVRRDYSLRVRELSPASSTASVNHHHQQQQQQQQSGTMTRSHSLRQQSSPAAASSSHSTPIRRGFSLKRNAMPPHDTTPTLIHALSASSPHHPSGDSLPFRDQPSPSGSDSSATAGPSGTYAQARSRPRARTSPDRSTSSGSLASRSSAQQQQQQHGSDASFAHWNGRKLDGGEKERVWRDAAESVGGSAKGSADVSARGSARDVPEGGDAAQEVEHEDEGYASDEPAVDDTQAGQQKKENKKRGFPALSFSWSVSGSCARVRSWATRVGSRVRGVLQVGGLIGEGKKKKNGYGKGNGPAEV